MLINFENLKSWLGYKNKAQVMKWLDEKGIGYKVAKNGEPVTTYETINKALSKNNPNYEGWQNAEF